MSEPQTDDTMIAGLLREREGLVQRGLDDRVAQVDEQLRLRGYEPTEQQKAEPNPGQRKTEQEQRAEPPKGRQQQGKSVT
ncbi:hypothetical protein [Streptomyces flaveolus]|uniref:Uncharacterized protein n=1 Tax=Streptomyces flaveolus TaxID=67297 RepID=A0ABV3A7G7_9ACTN